jgi:8-oxo-dGTP diphosphatase
MHNQQKPKPILVVAGVVLRETPAGTRILLARRKFDSSLEAGKWEFPGGKVEALEHPEATVVREIKEELDLTVTVVRIFDVASHVYETEKGPVHIVLLCYLCRTDQESLKLLDVSDARWVAPSELDSVTYASADIATVAKLKSFLATDSR